MRRVTRETCAIYRMILRAKPEPMAKSEDEALTAGKGRSPSEIATARVSRPSVSLKHARKVKTDARNARKVKYLILCHTILGGPHVRSPKVGRVKTLASRVRWLHLSVTLATPGISAIIFLN